MMKQLGIAIAVASTAFATKLDKGGKPYTLHLLRVWEGVKNESIDIQCAAWLHDLLEDFPEYYTPQTLHDLGFNAEVIRMVDFLTHDKDEDYMKYITRIGTNKGATKVKLSDLRDNSDISRLPSLEEKDFRRLEKYSRSYNYLINL